MMDESKIESNLLRKALGGGYNGDYKFTDFENDSTKRGKVAVSIKPDKIEFKLKDTKEVIQLSGDDLKHLKFARNIGQALVFRYNGKFNKSNYNKELIIMFKLPDVFKNFYNDVIKMVTNNVKTQKLYHILRFKNQIVVNLVKWTNSRFIDKGEYYLYYGFWDVEKENKSVFLYEITGSGKMTRSIPFVDPSKFRIFRLQGNQDMELIPEYLKNVKRWSIRYGDKIGFCIEEGPTKTKRYYKGKSKKTHIEVS